MCVRVSLTVAMLTIGGAAVAGAQSAGTPQHPLTWTHASGRTSVLFPAGDIFPVYVADPQRPTNALSESFYPKARIPSTGSVRVGLSAGGRFGVFRSDPATPGGRSWQISISAGLDVLFDSKHRLDALGWDGNYGVTVTTTKEGPLSLKVGVLHQSSHLGDEYEERTGATRINYTREEVAFGARWRLTPQWQAYGETAVAYRNRNENQEPWRGQGGIEYETVPKIWGNRFAWYAAGDFSGTQERDWRLDTSLQGGIVTRTNGHTYRLGVAWTDGRPPIGEFFNISERWFTLGLWLESVIYPRGFAPRTPRHALSRAAAPARSDRVARSPCSLVSGNERQVSETASSRRSRRVPGTRAPARPLQHKLFS